MPGSARQNSMFEPSPVKQYVQKGNPMPVTSCGRRRNDGSPLFKRKRKPDVKRTIGRGKNFNKAKPTGTGAAAGGGMTQKGVNEYKRKNPGSKLKTAVTTKPSKLKPGSKAAKRRKSFCARSKGWKSKRGLAARRRWNC
tara:strand:- start:260 stop:676 length:417 start_codon:yes stop_codon:yes gene_type:complete